MEFIKLLAETGVLAIIIMVAGWGFVFKNSRALARQSEINALAAQIEKILQELADENYKFWQAYDPEKDPDLHLVKSKFYSSYVEHRCNLAEKKISLLFGKCQGGINPAVEKTDFLLKSVKLLSELRDRATMNSENSALVKDRYARISAVNKLTIKLNIEVGELLNVRFMPMSQWKWPDNY